MTDGDQQSADESSDGYIKYGANNYISRGAELADPNQIQLKGKTVVLKGVKIEGAVRMGRYCMLQEDVVLAPPEGVPLILRGHLVLEQGCEIKAAALGSHVFIGAGAKIGERCILKDNIWVAPNSVLGDDTVIPPFSRVEGAPAKVTAELAPAVATELAELAQDAYQAFVDSKPKVK
uniref:Dynactin subunit 5 n=1 Tax=Grammatophora oceanica TaxID=210454 RepID=A0A7S1UVC3_9STRA|mmetsp:Transcript_21598/g.32153  ORF Transcript_21598/g.32153 Transcript_21598/m.32153 type:complete len:177 (+) Transcript_21598:82-612(+)